MLPDTAASKVTAAHLSRTALLYVRQSSLKQVLHNTESAIRQYDLRGRAIALGWAADQITVTGTGQGVPPGGDALAGEYTEAERERLGARVQGSMTQLLVAGVQPAAGGGDLAGIQARAWFSSRVAR